MKVRIRAENYKNNWSENGKEFIVKTRKNTAYFIKKLYFLIRKYTQDFSIYNICNYANYIQNQQKVDMSKIKMRLGNARSIR